jgi:Yip1 domain
MAAAPVPQTPVPEAHPLSEAARLIDTFIAPTKTFTDLRRSASWWAPFLISAIVSVIFVMVVDQKVGFRKVWDNQLQTQPKQAERIENMPAAQRESVIQKQVSLTKIISYSFPALTLIWYVIVAAVLLVTLKFAAGAEVKFKTLLALVVYSSLPGILKALLGILSLLAGVSSDSFTFQNPVATNPGYFIDPVTHPVLNRLLTSFDIFTFWTLVLAAIGITCISKVKSGTAFAVVFGWFLVLVAIGVGFSAAFS